MKRSASILALVLTCACVAPTGAQAQASKFAWQACPFLLDQGAKVVLARLKVKLRPEEFEGASEFACATAQLYQDSLRKSPAAQRATSDDPETIFCEKSSFSFCKNKKAPWITGERPPSFREALRQSARQRFIEGWAYSCHRNRLTPDECATAVLQEAERN